MILAFDIGGTRIRAAEAGTGGAIGPISAWPTPAQDLAAFVATLRAAAEAAAATTGQAPRGLSLSIAGVVDPDTGLSRVANIPCLDGLMLAEDLGRALGLPVIVSNDADCFALAEAGAGAGRGHRSVFGVILGTGVGGGLVMAGRIVTGAGGYAGEWGHGPVLRTEALGAHVPHWPCGCGLWGCVDTLGGARGLERLDAHLHGGVRSSVEITGAWQAGEAAAVRTLAVWLDLVSAPLAMVLNVTGSSVVPVGGGLGGAAGLVAALDREVRARILRRGGGPLLVPALLDAPGLRGAAMRAKQEWGDDRAHP